MTWRPLAASLAFLVLFVPVTSEALETNELLALVAMPLAVAAVSEVTDVPMQDLMSVVSLLNDADVPPAQFVEVVRYAPIALVVEEPERVPFVQFVRTRYDAGVIGLPLVTEIEREIRFYGIPDVELDIVAPSIAEREYFVVDRTEFLPLPVRTQLVEYRRTHPHGGPPGQLKKQRGLQTGAEVVHGSRGSDRVNVQPVERVTRPAAKAPKAEKGPKAGKAPKERGPKHQDRVSGNHGKGKGNAASSKDHPGKGKGKGKG